MVWKETSQPVCSSTTPYKGTRQVADPSKEPSRRQIAEALKTAAAYHFLRYGYSITFELGIQSWGRRRVDVVGNRIGGDLVIVEIKSSVADYRTDLKWTEYLPYADRFYLMFSAAVARKIRDHPELRARIPPQVGVLILGTDGFVKTVKPARRQEVTIENRLNILSRMAWRSGEMSKRTVRARQRVFLDQESKDEYDQIKLTLQQQPKRKVRRRRRARRSRSRN